MDQDNFSEAMINGETAFSNANYALALEWFRKALEEKSDDPRALLRAGTVCLPLKKYEESFDYFRKSMELDPENGDNAFNLANAYFIRGDHAKAFEFYSAAESKRCSADIKPRLYYQMALLCSMRRDIKAALTNFKKYEDLDRTGMVSLDPAVISEKIKLYMMDNDLGNAAKYAVQWISVAPAELRPYMVYFSILMAQKKYAAAGKVLDDAEKYAEIDAASAVKLSNERVKLAVAKAESSPSDSKALLDEAYNTTKSLMEKADASAKDELKLQMAEICMKLSNYKEAITIAESLLKEQAAEKNDAKPIEDSGEELDESDIEEMIYNDIQMMDEKIASGEIDEGIGEYAEVYYDDDGNAIRDFSDGLLDIEPDNEINEQEEIPEPAAEAAAVRKPGFYDKLYFILLSCYAAVEDYDNAFKTGGILKHSSNVYYSYFGRYIEAFSVKKLSESSDRFSGEDADKYYAEAIAFFRKRMLKGVNNNSAVIFRARMYAEIAKFAKAEEMANLLVLDTKTEVMAYIDECRKELQGM